MMERTYVDHEEVLFLDEPVGGQKGPAPRTPDMDALLAFPSEASPVDPTTQPHDVSGSSLPSAGPGSILFAESPVPHNRLRAPLLVVLLLAGVVASFAAVLTILK